MLVPAWHDAASLAAGAEEWVHAGWQPLHGPAIHMVSAAIVNNYGQVFNVTHQHSCPCPLRSQVDSGCDKELVFGDPTAPRFVYWEKKLRATPSGPDALTFDLLSIWGKIRAGLGAVGLVKGGPMPGGW